MEQLRELKSLGMSILYVGCESGDDEVLRRVNKGETLESSVEALQKIRGSGLKSSVMILNGLGGRELSKQVGRRFAQNLRIQLFYRNGCLSLNYCCSYHE